MPRHDTLPFEEVAALLFPSEAAREVTPAGLAIATANFWIDTIDQVFERALAGSTQPSDVARNRVLSERWTKHRDAVREEIALLVVRSIPRSANDAFALSWDYQPEDGLNDAILKVWPDALIPGAGYRKVARVSETYRDRVVVKRGYGSLFQAVYPLGPAEEQRAALRVLKEHPAAYHRALGFLEARGLILTGSLLVEANYGGTERAEYATTALSASAGVLLQRAREIVSIPTAPNGEDE